MVNYSNWAWAENNAPDIGRLIVDDEEEMKWLGSTLWSDIGVYVNKSSKVLDIGSGTGHFAKYLEEKGACVTTVDPNIKACANYQRLSDVTGEFDIVTMLNVLEHVKNPEVMLKQVCSLLKPDGLIFIRVPNECSMLQRCVRDMYKEKEYTNYWETPLHVNYFTPDTIYDLLCESGFMAMDISFDFPMELFLLFGLDYRNDPALGEYCHKLRRNLEMAIPVKVRQNLFADGHGRNMLVRGSIN